MINSKLDYLIIVALIIFVISLALDLGLVPVLSIATFSIILSIFKMRRLQKEQRTYQAKKFQK